MKRRMFLNDILTSYLSCRAPAFIYPGLYLESKSWDNQDEVAEKVIHSYRYPIWIVKALIELRKDSKLGY